MASVLFVDDDIGVRETFGLACKAAGHAVFTALSGREGIAVGSFVRPNVAFVDLNLPDILGTQVLRALLETSPGTAVVVVTGFASTRSAVEAMQLGACNYLEKPVDVDELIDIVSRLTAPRCGTPADDVAVATHAIARWARVVVKAIDSPQDPNTLSRWARLVGASEGAIRNWCRTANLPAKPSLNLARMLRVIRHYQPGTRVADLLDIIDQRTLHAFLRLGCEDAEPCQLPMEVREFLDRQQWVTDGAALRELRSVLLFGPGAPPAAERSAVNVNAAPLR